MKIDRHLAILNLLSEYPTLTAPYLAEKLEVSRRTINRDVEDLCKAGIPIICKQGNNGGISLMEGYKIDKTILKKKDLESIFTALNGLNSIDGSDHIHKLLARLEKEGTRSSQDQTMLIDLASHYKPSLSQKIDRLKSAIKAERLVSFTYYGPRGKSQRLVEPYRIVFRWSDWYLFGYSLARDDFRLFKLQRLWNLKSTDREFEKREVEPGNLAFDDHFEDSHEFVAVFSKEVEYLIVETYGPDSYTETEEGLFFRGCYTHLDFITRWLLSFGNKVQVISPEFLMEHLERQKI